MEEIFLDTLEVVRKIKSINNNYRVFRNLNKHRFEIYYNQGLNLDLQLVIPYDELDYRTVNLLNKTKKENADILFEEIEKNNLKVRGLVWN